MDDLSAILASIFSSGTFNEMLRRATPVALAAIGGSLTEHAGIMNIGMDGMILMGAFFGVFGSYLFTSAWGGVGLVLLMGLLVGLFFALFVVKFRSDEFIIGCALNTFALGLTTYLSRSVFGTSGAKGFPSLSTVDLPLLDKIPFLGAVLNGHSLFVYLTWLFVLVLWVFIYKTPYGFWLRASGEKPETLRTAGIEPEKMKWLPLRRAVRARGRAPVARLPQRHLCREYVQLPRLHRLCLRDLRRGEPRQGLPRSADVWLLRCHRPEIAGLRQL